MKKLFALMLCGTLVLSASFSSYAASTNAEQSFTNKFAITGGVNTEKEVEATFDKSKTISGTAEVGSTVIIAVSQVYKDETTSEPELYVITVGSSGYFSQSVDLAVGENLITVTAEKNEMISTKKVTIKRKKSEIKSELSKNISFPSVL